jgi:hypothetical protein
VRAEFWTGELGGLYQYIKTSVLCDRWAESLASGMSVDWQ